MFNFLTKMNYQFWMGSVFTGMGLATMFFPEIVMRLSLDQNYIHYAFGAQGMNPVVKFVTQCFGSQAALCGTLILSSRFTKNTFKIFGFCMIPYLIFDVLAYQFGPLSLFGAVGDGLGNIIFITCCWLGFFQ
jgi:hypothetical protein